jgi:hypothetical protein
MMTARNLLLFALLPVMFFSRVTASYAAGARGEALEVKAVKIHTPPVLDGRLDDRAWVEAALYGGKITGFVDFTGRHLVEYQSVVYIAYDNDNLYIAYQSFEPDVNAVVAESTTEKFSWGDDLVQIFLEPQINSRFVHYGINSGGKTSMDIITAAASMNKNYWSVEISIPWKVLGIIPERGKLIGFNAAAQKTVQSVTGKSSGWITWSPTYGRFNNPLRFGYLVLGSEVPVARIPETEEEDIF